MAVDTLADMEEAFSGIPLDRSACRSRSTHGGADHGHVLRGRRKQGVGAERVVTTPQTTS